jgi:hypothetical protein
VLCCSVLSIIECSAAQQWLLVIHLVSLQQPPQQTAQQAATTSWPHIKVHLHTAPDTNNISSA